MTTAGFRLSPPQRRLFRLAGSDPQPLRALAALELSPEVDLEAARDALVGCVRRHEILRTRCARPAEAALPVQVVDEEARVDFERHAPGVSPEADLDALWSEALTCPLALADGPALRVRARGRRLVLALAAPYADAAALVNLAGELEIALQGAPARDEAPLQYADVAAWMDEQAAGDEARAVRARCEPLLRAAGDLRLGLAEPAAPGAAFASLAVGVPAAPAQLAGVSPAALHLAAYALLLGRHCGVTSLTLGVAFDGRRHADLRGLPGLFTRHVPVGVTLDERRPFLDLAREVEQALAEIEPWHDQLDFDAGDGAPQGLPFLFEQVPATGPVGARVRLLRLHALSEPFRLRLELAQDGTLRLHGDARELLAPELHALAGQYAALLASACARPTAELRALSLLAPDEDGRAAPAWSAGVVSVPREVCLHELFEEQAARTPDRPALSCGATLLSFRELDARADRLARRLAQLGVGPEARVGLSLERSLEQVVAVLAVLKAGGAYVPLEPSHPPARRAALLADSGARVLLLQGRPDFDLPPGVACVQADEGAPGDGRPQSGVGPRNLAYVLYTSGSTGAPKGCQIEHRSLVNYVTWLTRDLLGEAEGGDFSLHSPLAFDFTVTSLYGSLLRGRCLHVQPPAEIDALLRASLAPDSGVDSIKLTPSHVRVLAELELRAPGLRRVITGGEALTPAHVATLRRLLPGAEIVNHYGPTEATVGCISGPVGEGRVAIGRPITNLRAHLLDARDEPAPVGLTGEICVAGEGLARGYHGRPDLTAERFVPDPFGDGGRLYRTGDLGRRLADGRIEYLGRRDEQVKVRGHRIEPAEIEAVLARFPGVRQAAVLAGADAAGQVRLEAGVAWQPGAAVSLDLLREHASRLLPDFMLPARMVTVDALPLTPNGKLDRRELRARLQQAGAGGRAHVPPRTPVEAQLAETWRQVLGLERVGVEDNFFELGGDSILVIQIVVRLRKAGLELHPQQFFEHQTIARLARVAARREAPRAEQGLVRGPLPLTPVQERFFALQPDQAQHFNHALLLDLDRARNPELVEALLARPDLGRRAVQALVAHHDALRLRFTRRDGAWEQDNAGLDEVPAFGVEDLSALDAGERAAAIEAAAARLQSGFDLAAGPLLRVVLFSPGAGAAGHLLCLAHHLVVDGVSWRILLDDFHTALGQLAAGAPVELPAKTSSYREWAYRLRPHARRLDEAERAHWRALAAVEPDPLPADFPSSQAARVGDDRRCASSLSAEATHRLLHETADAYATRIDDLLLAALALGLHAWCGAERALVEVEGHGRDLDLPGVDLSRTVGWFTAHYPVLLAVQAGRGPGATLQAVKESLRAARGGAGWGLLRNGADEQTRAELWRAPRPALGFNYLGQLDRELRADAPWRLGSIGTGPEQSPDAPQAQPLGLTAAVVGGRLDLAWRFSSARFRPERVADLARAFEQALLALIEHCRDRSVAGRTPSDFPAARLGQRDIDRLLADQPAAHVRAGRLDAYRLTPLQQGLLYHSLWSPEAGDYRGQVSCTIAGALDPAALREAWRRVFARHAVLRSSFRWRQVDPPVQLVLPEVELPFGEHDWSGRAGAALEQELEALARADRETPFDLERAPLARFQLVRLGVERWRFIWTYHHILLDGWSSALVMQDVFALYADPRAAREEPRPYRDYVLWLQGRDAAAAEAFWRAELLGFHTPNRLAAERAPAAEGPARWFEERLELSAEAAADLQALARRAQVTLNTLVQGAWALVAAHASGQDDVVFGATLAGRPPELDGVERMVGLFINTLPVRVRVDPGLGLTAWLQALQARQAERDPHAHAALVDVQGWSELPRGTALFESLVVFENYPVEESLAQAASGLELRDVAYQQHSNYPLTLTVMPGARLALVASCSEAHFTPQGARRLLDLIQALLVALPSAAGDDLAALQRRLTDLAAEQAAAHEALRRQDNLRRLRARQRTPQEARDDR